MDINEPNQHHTEFDCSAKQNLIPANEQSAILAQIADKAERKLKLRWILAISSLPLFGIYAAFGIAPQTMTDTIATATVVEEITLPDAASTQPNVAEQHFWYKDHVRRDDTLNIVFSI